MKSLLIIINNFQEVSHNSHLLRLMSYLAENNIHIHLLALSSKGELKQQFHQIPNVKIVSIREVLSFLHNHRSSVVLTKELRSEYFVFFIRYVCGYRNIKHITIRPSYGFLFESWWKIVKNFLFFISLYLVDKNIGVGKTVCQRMLGNWGIKSNQVICIPNSIPHDYSNSSSIKSRDHLVRFVYSGYLESRKNVLYLLQVFQQLPDTTIVTIIGDGPMRQELENYVSNNSLKHRVLFVGHVNDVKSFLSQADGFLFLSKMEGLSLSLLEAMALGLTCCVSDIPENRELITHGVNGIVMPLDNHQTAAEILSRQIQNRKQFRSLGLLAKQQIQEAYIDEISFKLHQDLIRSFFYEQS